MQKRHLEWINELASGDVSIDAHIKEFLRNANDYIEAKDSDYRVEKLDKTLGYLIDYSRKHFSAQEEMMRRINYPSVREHIAEHKDFVKQISKLYKQLLVQKNPNSPKDEDYDERGIEGVISDTYDFIINWHDNHMLAGDKRLADYYNYEFKH